MLRLLTLNLDFVLILQGGLLLLLAVSSRNFSQGGQSRSWRRLATYAALLAVRSGLELAAYENGPAVQLTVLSDLLLAASSFSLIEFAHTHTSTPARVGRWIQLVSAIGLIVAQLSGGSPAMSWAGFVVGLFSSGWSAVVLWRAGWANGKKSEGRSLRQAGLVIAGCQMLVTLPDQFFAEGMPGYDLAQHLPPIAARCALFFILTATVLHYQVSRQNKNATGRDNARNRRRIICATAILSIVLVGLVSADFAGRKQDEAMRTLILTRTQIAAASVQPEDVRQLHWDERDLTHPPYLRLKSLMIAMRRANADLRFVLLAGIKDGHAYFLVDSENPDSKDYSPPGQSYDEATPDYLVGLSSNRPFILGPEKDRWGTWMFADVPILDEQHRTLAYLELDIAAADWDARIAHARLPVLLITLLIVALVLGSFQALESQRESSALIELSEQRNRSLVEGSPDCVQMFDLAGCYVAVNQNGLRALGLPESSVIGRSFAEFWPIETRPQIDEAIRTTLQGKATSFEADYLTPDGRTMTWRVATNPIHDTTGRVCSFVGICVDLTDRKRAELALLAAKKTAEEATQAKSDFLAVMSHELRTPLAGVIGMLDLLQGIPLDPLARRYTKFARDSSDTLLHLLDDALDSAKMEAGKLVLETVPFHPYEYFESTFESAKLRAATKGLSFRHEVAPSVPAVLLGDPVRLRQIVSNLINNALKFTERGSVSVALSTEPANGNWVLLRIAVTDTGIGISEENRLKLFSKYAQAETSTTRRYGGTGLGLSIVKSLAELMGGEAGVKSKLGEGSTFYFSGKFEIDTATAPSALASSPIQNVAPATTLPVRPLRVLIVDDDIANRTVAESLVAQLGHRDVAFATNGREAVDRLIAEKFDVVLMDNRMPVMDGFTATRLIRDPSTKATDPAVYIIALTANASTDDRAKCLAAGMNDFVTKPVRAAAIKAAFARAEDYFQAKTKPAAPVSTPLPNAGDENLPPGLSEAELLASLEEDETAPAAEPSALPPETLGKITEIFLREAPRRMEAMRLALTRQDAATIGLEAHTLKSNARYVNATRLADLCAELEKLADRKQLAEIEPLLREAEQVFAALHQRLLHPLST